MALSVVLGLLAASGTAPVLVTNGVMQVGSYPLRYVGARQVVCGHTLSVTDQPVQHMLPDGTTGGDPTPVVLFAKGASEGGLVIDPSAAMTKRPGKICLIGRVHRRDGLSAKEASQAGRTRVITELAFDPDFYFGR